MTCTVRRKQPPFHLRTTKRRLCVVARPMCPPPPVNCSPDSSGPRVDVPPCANHTMHPPFIMTIPRNLYGAGPILLGQKKFPDCGPRASSTSGRGAGRLTLSSCTVSGRVINCVTLQPGPWTLRISKDPVCDHGNARRRDHGWPWL